jgi:hypothetical protein
VPDAESPELGTGKSEMLHCELLRIYLTHVEHFDEGAEVRTGEEIHQVCGADPISSLSS